VLVYRPFADTDTAQLEWVSRNGKDAAPVGPPGPYIGVDLAPDASVAAVTRSTERDVNIWLIDINRGSPSRLTSNVFAQTPRWSPRGDALAYAAIHDAPPMPVIRTLAGDEKRLVRVLSATNITSWSPDGRWVVAHATDVKTLGDVWLYATDGQAAPRAILRSAFDEREAAVSPNGKLVAFLSNDTETQEVYIATFPEPGRRLKVSTSGGAAPRWNGDGTELFFRSGDRMVVVAVPSQWNGDLPGVGAERTLFTLPPNVTAWTVAPDGQRFLLNRRVAEAVEPPAEVVVNWASR
jgi:Tol biopolymer transport system component